MEHDVSCAFCDLPSGLSCRRCDRPYCSRHGRDLCAACLDPAAAAPSPRLVRAALISLPVAVLLGCYFLFGSPRLPSEQAHAAVAVTRTSTGAKARATPATVTSPAATPPYPSNTPDSGPHDYTIKAGDTLDAIAVYYGVRTETIVQLNPSINPTNLHIGQVIHIPPTR